MRPVPSRMPAITASRILNLLCSCCSSSPIYAAFLFLVSDASGYLVVDLLQRLVGALKYFSNPVDPDAVIDVPSTPPVPDETTVHEAREVVRDVRLALVQSPGDLCCLNLALSEALEYGKPCGVRESPEELGL